MARKSTAAPSRSTKRVRWNSAKVAAAVVAVAADIAAAAVVVAVETVAIVVAVIAVVAAEIAAAGTKRGKKHFTKKRPKQLGRFFYGWI
jgi:hypothetical protein